MILQKFLSSHVKNCYVVQCSSIHLFSLFTKLCIQMQVVTTISLFEFLTNNQFLSFAKNVSNRLVYIWQHILRVNNLLFLSRWGGEWPLIYLPAINRSTFLKIFRLTSNIGSKLKLTIASRTAIKLEISRRNEFFDDYFIPF